MKLKKSPLIVIFMIVFIDLIGFGIIIPLTPFFAKELNASASQVGWLMSIFSLMQFLFSPFWGRLSDRFGRRPILLISLFGSGLSYLIMAFSLEFEMLLLSRALAGFFGANISTAMAYIADITPENDRSKGMGLIGAAFGLGFITGPALGGFLSQIGFSLGNKPPYGIGFAALGAAAICFVNFLVAVKVLKESLTEELKKKVQRKESRYILIKRFLVQPVLGVLITLVFIATFAMAHMESTLALYVNEIWGWNVTKASFAFVYVGVVSVFTQGFLIRRLLPKFGEPKMIILGSLGMMIGLTLIGFSKEVPLMMVAVTIMGLGNGFLTPALFGSISLKSSKDEQGAAMGVAQSFSALGRILGPLSGGYVYEVFGKESPFWTAGFVMFIGVLVITSIIKKMPSSKGMKNAPPAVH